MSNYVAEKDLLYYESVLSKDVLELVDLIRHSAWMIKHQERNPFKIMKLKINLQKPKSKYTFFWEQWADKPEIECLILKDEDGNSLKGLKVSDLHIAAWIYGMRQNYFKVIDPDDPKHITSLVGWYLEPKEVLINCIPSFFEDFESAYKNKGAVGGLQGREFDILGYLSNSVAEYVRRNYDPNSPYKQPTKVPLPSTEEP